jgi:HTH-type transcriptional regulator / antitoxin HipB
MEQITRTPKQLGTLLLRRRRELSLSEEALASRIHLRQATVSAPENSAVYRRRGTLFDTLWALDLELLVRPRSKGSAREVEQ